MREAVPTTMDERTESIERGYRTISARIGRTDFGHIRHRWRERFGRELGRKIEILDWLCSEGYERDEAEDMTLKKVVELLRPAPRRLNEIDQMILAVMEIDCKIIWSRDI